jgi:hypothetical protein
MRRISTSIDIDASTDQVWAVLSDLDRYHEWNPFIREAAGTAAVGARLSVRIFPATGKPSTFRPTVLAATPGRELRWLGRFILPGIFDGEHMFTLAERGSGTHLVQAETFRGLLVPFLGKQIDSWVADFTALNQALRRRVEELVAA